MKKVDLYARGEDGRWTLIFKEIDEEQAIAIWAAGMKTGENRFSIEDEESRKIREMNRRRMK